MQINRTRLVLIGLALLSVGVLAMTWFLGISPQISSYQASTEQYAQTKSENDAEQIKVNQLRAQYAKLDDLKRQLADYQTHIPVAAQQPELIREVDAASSSSGVTITQFTVGDTATYTSPSWFKAPDTANRLVSVGVTIASSGTADQVQAFVGNLQRMQRYLTVSEVSYATDSTDSKVTVTGNVWVLQSAEDAAAAPSASASPSASSTTAQ